MIKQKKRIILISLFLIVFSVLGFTSIVDTISGGTHSTIAYADETSSSSEEKEKDTKKDKDTSTTNSQSEWNSALSQLSASAVGVKDGENENSDGDDMATIGSVISGDHTLSVWGFMGISNTDVWEKNNNASATASYTGLLSDRNNDVGKAYANAASFAYVLQANGADQPVRSGFESTSTIQKILGWIMNIAYVVTDCANKFFEFAINLFKDINPIQWAIKGANTNDSALRPLAEFVNTGYQVFQKYGLAFIGLFITIWLVLAIFGVSIGGQGKSQGSAIVNTGILILKKFFVFTFLPVFALAMLLTITEYASDLFKTDKASVSNYAVLGSMIDYDSWVMKSRLGLPGGVQILASFDDKKVEPLSHADILAINADGANISQAYALKKGIVSGSGNYNPDINSSVNSQADDRVKGMLSTWTSGTTITAADYASAASKSIKVTDSDKSLSDLLVTDAYNSNSSNYINGRAENIKGNTHYRDPEFSNVFTSKDGLGALKSNEEGGLSTLGMYAYLLTTATDSSLSVSNTENLANGVDQAEHKSVVLVGSGVGSLGNLIWAFGLIVGMAIIVLGYLFEVLKAYITSIPSLIVAVFRTGTMSLAGGVQLIGLVVGLGITVFGSALMYLLAQLTFITLGQMGDSFFTNVGSVSSSFMSNSTELGQLASGASNSAMQAAFNILYGVFLLWVAGLLVRYRGVICASIAQSFEEGLNRILIAISSISNSSSRGTNGSILSSTNTSQGNTSTLTSMATKTALLGGGAGLVSSGLSNGFGGDGSDGKDGSDSDSKNSNTNNNNDKLESTGLSSSDNNNNDTTSLASGNDNSSLKHTGDASERLGLQNMANQATQSGTNSLTDGLEKGNELLNDQSLANKDQVGNQELMSNKTNQNGLQNEKDKSLTNQNQNDLQNEKGQSLANQDVNQNGLQREKDKSLVNQDNNQNDLQNGNDTSLVNKDLNQNGLQNEKNDSLVTSDMNQNSLEDSSTNALNSDLDKENTSGLNSELGTELDNQNGLNSVATSAKATQDGRSTDLGQSQKQTLTNGSKSNAGLTSVAVDKNANSGAIMSKMNEVQLANQQYEKAQSLAQRHPDNQALQNKASSAEQHLQASQKSALGSYQSQSVGSLGNNSLHAGLMDKKADMSSVSVGSVENSIGNIQSAQDSYNKAVKSFGANSEQASSARQSLTQAKQSASQLGLSDKAINNPDTIRDASTQINALKDSVNNGTWSSVANSGAKSSSTDSLSSSGNSSRLSI